MIYFVCKIDRGGEYGGRNSMELVVLRIEKDYAPVGKYAGEEFAEGGSKVLAWTVTFFQDVGNRRWTDQIGDLVDHRIDLVGEDEAGNGCILGATGSRPQLVKSTIGANDSCVIYFRQIVIFGGKPKDRDTINAHFSRLGSNFDRRDGFENGEQGTTEESNLLAGYDGVSTGPESIKIRQRLLGGTKTPVLAFKNGCYGLPARSFVRDGRSFVSNPLAKIWRARVKLLQIRGFRQKIEKKARRMGNLRKWDTVRAH